MADTVENFDSSTKEGNGLVFTDFNVFSLFATIIRALELRKNKRLWKALQKNAMKSDYSWKYSASEYVKLYNKGISFSTKKEVREKTIEDFLT